MLFSGGRESLGCMALRERLYMIAYPTHPSLAGTSEGSRSSVTPNGRASALRVGLLGREGRLDRIRV